MIEFVKTQAALDILAAHGLLLDIQTVLSRVEEFQRLSSTWNLAAKLMSRRDLENRFDEHVADSLSLALHVDEAIRQGSEYVDIGSGGGFPAIPLAFVLPQLSASLVERSSVKADFLRHAVSRLVLPNFHVVQASYPDAELAGGHRIYTARATENPSEIDRHILRAIRPGDLYLGQRDLEVLALETGASAEQVYDPFSATGLRRGVLYKAWR